MKRENDKSGPRRGRPRGGSAKGRKTESHLFETAVRLFQERGYEATTLRAIAAEAGVSVGLLYRYFPNKRAVVFALYGRLTDAFVQQTTLPEGPWRDRVMTAVRQSLGVLAPYRACLSALGSTLVSGEEEGVLSAETGFSRDRVTQVFVEAVCQADDAPPAALAEAVGRLCYTGHLSLILWWLLDRTPEQKATEELVSRLNTALAWVTPMLAFPAVATQLLSTEALVAAALFGHTGSGDAFRPLTHGP